MLELIVFKTFADLRAEAARGYLGLLWWVIEPLMYMSVFYLVFGVIYSQNEPNFVSFLLVGLVVWKWFDATVRPGAVAIIDNISLIRQVYLPKYIFPVVVVCINTVKFLIVFSLLLLFLLFLQVSQQVPWGMLILILVIQFSLHISVTVLLAAVVPFLPDLKLVIGNVLMLMMFVSGVFFNLDMVPEEYRAYFFLNPMAVLIDSYRKVLLFGQQPDTFVLLVVFTGSLIGILIGFMLLKRYDHSFAKASLI